MAKSNNPQGKVYISGELDVELARMIEQEAARTPGGMDAFLENCFRAASKALN